MIDKIAYEEKLNIYVKYAVESGVKPLEVFLKPIFEPYNGGIVAYDVEIRANGILTGVLEPDDYMNGALDEETSERFAYRAIKKALAAQKALKAAEISFKAVFVRLPVSVLYARNLFENLRLILAESGTNEKDNKVVLKLDAASTAEESAKLKEFLEDVASAGFRAAISGYGGEDFSIERLLDACPDFIFTAEKATEIVSDREKKAALAPMINFAKSFGAEIIATGVSNDDELREFRSRDCFGFVPAKKYRGALSIDGKRRTIADTIAEGGEDD